MREHIFVKKFDYFAAHESCYRCVFNNSFLNEEKNSLKNPLPNRN